MEHCRQISENILKKWLIKYIKVMERANKRLTIHRIPEDRKKSKRKKCSKT